MAKKTKMMMMRLMNLSSFSGLMHTRGETEIKFYNYFVKVGHGLSFIRKNIKIIVEFDSGHNSGFEPPRIGFVLTHPGGLMAGRSPNPTICTPVTGSGTLGRAGPV